MSNIVRQVAVLPSYNSMATVSLQIVRQVAVLPSYNSEATASSLCSLSVPILFQFILIYLNFYWIYLNLFEFYGIFQERVWECLGTINQQASLPCSVQHTY